MQIERKVITQKIPLILGGLALKGLVLFSGVAEAQTCALNVKGLQEAFVTFCSAESACCTRSFYLNEEEVAVNFIAQTHRQCSRENHPAQLLPAKAGRLDNACKAD